MSKFEVIRSKMKAAGLSTAAISAFEYNYSKLKGNEHSLIGEREISPVHDLPEWENIADSIEPASTETLNQTVVIKLNGGLGTSMGLQKAKSLLPVRGDLTFLDLIAQQIISLRETYHSSTRLLLMNSFSTSQDTRDALKKFATSSAPDLANPEEVELMQNKVPKILMDSLLPAEWPELPSLEWCPPGHGDIYAALLGSGWLEKLLAQGVKYAFISNSDNLGATLDPRLLNWFAKSNAPFLMEVTHRTLADKKGGHLALRKSDSQLLLREVAQCPELDMPEFQNTEKHCYFNTNSLWLRLDVLRDILAANNGILPLPVIVNGKTLDPRDSDSPAVYQLEVAMGAGIECFPGAQAISVSRSRFAPVKTTADLFALRSDAYEITPGGQVKLVDSRNGIPPIIELDPKLHKLVDSLDKLGTPSLVNVQKLKVRGDMHFAKNQPLSGNIEINVN